MQIDHARRYVASDDFFALGGSVIMKLSTSAAISVCEAAEVHGLLVVRIEGGIWRFPGFEARIDCIWDGKDPPVTPAVAAVNNRRATEFIRLESEVHDTFVVTTTKMTGWEGWGQDR